MAEKDTQYTSKVKDSGIFDFQELYNFLYDWLLGEGYSLTEKKYTEKIEGDAKKVEINWEGKKKVSDYFQFIIKADWRVLGMKSIEVQREGKKIKMNSGNLEIKFTAVLVKDYESRWEDAPIWKFLRGIYDKYLIRNRIEQYEEKIISEVEEMIAQTKAFLALEGKR
jgi:hypothetical protein